MKSSMEVKVEKKTAWKKNLNVKYWEKLTKWGLDEEMHPITWIEWPISALVGSGSLWRVVRERTITYNKRTSWLWSFFHPSIHSSYHPSSPTKGIMWLPILLLLQQPPIFPFLHFLQLSMFQAQHVQKLPLLQHLLSNHTIFELWGFFCPWKS